jgi:phage gp29-like protein
MPRHRLQDYSPAKPVATAEAVSPRITAPAATDFGWYGTKLTPAQVRSLLAGMRAGSFTDGYDLFSEMQDTWHTLAKNLQQLREAVATVRYQVSPATAEGQAPTADALAKAATCRQALQGFYPEPASDENGFEDFIYDLTDALVLGVNVQEILWDRPRDLILPRATCWVHPNQYGLGNDGRLGLSAAPAQSVIYQAARASVVEPFTPDKFIVASYKTRSGARTVGGLLRPLAWWWCAVQFGRDWVLRNAELFGQPIRDIEYDPSIKPDDLAALKLMAANMGSSAWITRPAGTKLNLVEANKTGDASPQAELLDRADRACDLMILWQTLTSSTGPTGGGSLALGQVHLGVLESRKQNIARWAANVISYQLFPAICRLNHGDADECPVLAPDHTKTEEPKAKAERLALCKTIVPMPKTWTYEQLGIPIPAEGEETIVQAAPPAPIAPPPAAPLQAKQTLDLGPGTLDRSFDAAALAELRTALGDDLKPVFDRLNAALAIEDDTARNTELQAILAELPKSLAQDSGLKTQDAMSKIFGTALLNGLLATPTKGRV